MNPHRRSHRWKRCHSFLTLGLAGLFALAGPALPLGTAGDETPPTETQPAREHRPVTLELMQEYLKRWQIENMAVDRENQHIQFKVQANPRMPALKCLIWVKTKRDGRTFDRLYIGFLELANVPAGNPALLEVLKTLATLNWDNALGKYSWDESDGEIRLEYTMVANEGLCYADFADVLQRLSLIADTDRPTIQRPIWGKG